MMSPASSDAELQIKNEVFMKKKVYSLYSKGDKDSSLFSAENTEELVDIVLQCIFDNEEFDEFFDMNGDISLSESNKAYFYEVISDYTLYCIANYDSEHMKLTEINVLQSIDIKALLDSLNVKIKAGNII